MEKIAAAINGPHPGRLARTTTIHRLQLVSALRDRRVLRMRIVTERGKPAVGK